MSFSRLLVLSQDMGVTIHSTVLLLLVVHFPMSTIGLSTILVLRVQYDSHVDVLLLSLC